MTVLSEEQMQEILNGAMEKIKESVIEDAIDSVSWAVKRSLTTEVDKLVGKFVKEEVGPELITSLDANKSMIIEAAIFSANKMALLLAETMSETLAERIGDSWKRDKIIKAMFGG